MAAVRKTSVINYLELIQTRLSAALNKQFLREIKTMHFITGIMLL